MKLKSLPLILAALFLIHPVTGAQTATVDGFAGTQAESLEKVTMLMKEYESRENVSLMKFGKMAMTMGKTVGGAGNAWTRKVAKAFKRVSTVYMLDYGDSPISVRDEIDSEVQKYLIPSNLVLTNKIGNEVSDETFGETSHDGKHVSDMVIVMYGQSVVCVKGTVLATDVERIVRRLNKQL